MDSSHLRVTGAHGDLHQVQDVDSVLLQQQRAVEDVVHGLKDILELFHNESLTYMTYESSGYYNYNIIIWYNMIIMVILMALFQLLADLISRLVHHLQKSPPEATPRGRPPQRLLHFAQPTCGACQHISIVFAFKPAFIELSLRFH